MGEWISVDDSLPETWVDVIVCGRLSRAHKGRVVRSGRHWKEGESHDAPDQWEVDGDDDESFVVESWQPAPRV